MAVSTCQTASGVAAISIWLTPTTGLLIRLGDSRPAHVG
jgi:hypothetical protein